MSEQSDQSDRSDQSDQSDEGVGAPVQGMHLEPEGAVPDRSGGRRRAGVGLTAVALVAAAGGVGYGLGLSFADDEGDAGSADLVPTAGTEAPATLPPVATTDGAVTTDPSVPATGVLQPVDTVLGDDDSASSTSATGGIVTGSVSGPGFGYSMFGSEPLETLFERTTVDGIVLRAQLGQLWDPPTPADFGGEWQPPAWCFPSGQLRVSLAGEGVTDVGGTGWFTEPFKGRSVSWLMLGGADGQPHWVVAAQVPAGTTNVIATFADGATDTVEPQNGVALLAVAGTPAAPTDDMGYPMPQPPTFEVSFEGADESSTVTSGQMGMWSDPEYQESCSPPPPPLPDPGEQPADPAVAEAEITDVMTRLYDGTVQGEGGLVDDDTGIADARAQVAEGGYATEASNAQAVIEELVFTSPTEAWFRYRVDTGGVGLNDRYGIARLSAGAWRVTRDTVCQDLSMAGGDCGGGWQPVLPPSMQSGTWTDDMIGMIEDTISD